MPMSEFPTEILAHIIGLLHDRSDLLGARFVCRSWNALATHNVFHTLELAPTREAMDRWNQLTSSKSIQSAIRTVIIHTTMDGDDNPGGGRDAWYKWEKDGQYPEYTNAMAGIDHLPLLCQISIHFSEKCSGVEENLYEENLYHEDHELWSTRANTLRAVFSAIQQRARKPDMSTISFLRIENLQNLKLPDFTSSDLFKSVMKDVTRLQLYVATEYNKYRADCDLHKIERVQFEPYLHQHWISPVANQLTFLSLNFHEPWGSIPGVFHGRGLVFPHLRKLALGNFAISHHNHLDWVLAQTTLQHIRFDDCYIATHLCTDNYIHGGDNVAQWQVETHDWEKLVPSTVGFYDGQDAVYYFSGTWEQVFDKIRTQLPRLNNFELHLDGNNVLGDPSDLTSFEMRYIAFEVGIWPTPWLKAERGDGEFYFNNINQYSPNFRPINPSEDRWDGDERALDELVKTIQERSQKYGTT